MVTKGGKDHTLLQAERPGYEPQRLKKPKPGWNSMTQLRTEDHTRHFGVFDGCGQARPYLYQNAGSPKARAKSGPRSLHAWQRDYNTNGNIEEKVKTMRYARVVELKKSALRLANNRNVPVEEIEEELFNAWRASGKRTDTGLRKEQQQLEPPPGSSPTLGSTGATRLFEYGEKLEENFSFTDAKDMFRGESWESMSDALGKLHEFRPEPRKLQEIQKQADLKSRGSFSAGVTPGELKKAMARSRSPSPKSPKALKTLGPQKPHENVGLACIDYVQTTFVNKYGSIAAAWRHCLDADGNGKLSFEEWHNALRGIGFEGNIKATYQQLDVDNSGFVSFGELAPDLAANLHAFKMKCFKKYGRDWDLVWKHIDEKGSEQIDQKQFDKICKAIGYDESLSFDIFKQIRLNRSRKFVTLQDLRDMPKFFPAFRGVGASYSVDKPEPEDNDEYG